MANYQDCPNPQLKYFWFYDFRFTNIWILKPNTINQNQKVAQWRRVKTKQSSTGLIITESDAFFFIKEKQATKEMWTNEILQNTRGLSSSRWLSLIKTGFPQQGLGLEHAHEPWTGICKCESCFRDWSWSLAWQYRPEQSVMSLSCWMSVRSTCLGRKWILSEEVSSSLSQLRIPVLFLAAILTHGNLLEHLICRKLRSVHFHNAWIHQVIVYTLQKLDPKLSKIDPNGK